MSDRKESILSLRAKTEIAKTVITDALEGYVRPTIVWSGGKDSTVVLHLVKQLSEEYGFKMPPALFIDHGDHFPETFDILDKTSQAWGFRIIYTSNNDVIGNVVENKVEVNSLSYQNRREIERVGFFEDEFEYTLHTEVGNHLLKTVAMNFAIERYRFDSLFTGVRWDENKARSTEVFISSRERPDHVRVQPVLPFTERDIWNYIFQNNLPYHPKYIEGYRSIDGVHDSTKISEIPAWEQDMEVTRERAGRSQDKEEMMEKLRSMGYM